MLPQLLTMRSMLADLRDSFVSVDSTPDLSSLRAMRDQIATLMARLIGSIKLTSFSTVYSFVIHWLMRIAKLGLEALDWLLLPRLAWKITVRHCLALLVLFCIKVAWRVITNTKRHERCHMDRCIRFSDAVSSSSLCLPLRSLWCRSFVRSSTSRGHSLSTPNT